jgi:drug/metabolite transporter (DMT)-like permease
MRDYQLWRRAWSGIHAFRSRADFRVSRIAFAQSGSRFQRFSLPYSFFREHLGLPSLIASVLVILGALLFGYQTGPVRGDFVGVFAIVGACLSWAIDNNLSQRLSVRDPAAVAQIKTAGAGLTNMTLALLSGHVLPAPTFMIGSLILGSLSYGVSLVCVMHALRYLGAAREAAWFSTAPFIGAALSLPIFGVLPNKPELVDIVLMICGVVLLVREEHDHAHSNNDHHQHAHVGPVIEPHAHPHRHHPIKHKHPHASDIHHRRWHE